MQSSKTLVLVGRTNVGKSTLFNSLATRSQRKAIVHDAPGVTRDVLEVKMDKMASWTLLDTPGWTRTDDHFAATFGNIYERTLKQATQVAMVIDRLYDLTLDDYEIAEWLQKSEIPFIVIVNKVDADIALPPSIQKFIEKREAFFVSALHKKGLVALRNHLKLYEDPEENSSSDVLVKDSDPLCHVVFVGRANAGKSTLFNACLGEDRSLVSDVPHTTRDTVFRVVTDKKGHKVCFFDTAGLRKGSKVQNILEKMSVSSTQSTLLFAHVVCCVLDATCALERQDLRIISDACKNGRAVLIILNKIDLVKDHKKVMSSVKEFFLRHFADLHVPFILPISALNKKGISAIIPKVHAVHKAWSSRIPTGPLNQHLRVWQEQHPPPRVGKTVNKVLFISQINRRPPTFLLSVANKNFPEFYTRYLRGKIQSTFGLECVPIRMVVRSR